MTASFNKLPTEVSLDANCLTDKRVYPFDAFASCRSSKPRECRAVWLHALLHLVRPGNHAHHREPAQNSIACPTVPPPGV